MKLAFSNNSTKVWLARKGPAKVFGKDVDKREGLSDTNAIKWFDQVWEGTLRGAVEQAKKCDLDFVLSKLPGNARGFVKDDAEHREFTVAGCFFIVQLPDKNTADQLWLIPATSGDPRTLYVRFETVPIKEAFDALAGGLGYKPEELGEKLLLDFMETMTKKSSRSR
jgi:hypothetical protein